MEMIINSVDNTDMEMVLSIYAARYCMIRTNKRGYKNGKYTILSISELNYLHKCIANNDVFISAYKDTRFAYDGNVIWHSNNSINLYIRNPNIGDSASIRIAVSKINALGVIQSMINKIEANMPKQ